MKTFKPLMWLAALVLSAFAAAKAPLTVSAESAIVIDAESGKVLWEKDADTPRYPASTTKILTALLLIENTEPTDIITAPADIEKVTESSMHLKPGEKITAGDMLYALMLRSANDGCVAVAVHISGSVEKFAELMNERAKELGCTNSHFHNPNGLNDDLHTTTAHDLAMIARAAMREPEFAEAVRTVRYKIKRDPKISPDTMMRNRDKYLLKDPTADGIKTGWTIPAGKCFVGSATRDGYRVITVVLKSQDWQADHAAMLDWAFANHQREYALKKGQTLGPIPVLGGSVDKLTVMPSDSVVHIWDSEVPKAMQVEYEYPRELRAPLKAGEKIGEVVLTDEDGFTQKVDLLAGRDVAQTVTSKIVSSARTNPGIYFLCGCVGAGALFMRKKSRRRVKKLSRPASAPQK